MPNTCASPILLGGLLLAICAGPASAATLFRTSAQATTATSLSRSDDDYNLGQSTAQASARSDGASSSSELEATAEASALVTGGAIKAAARAAASIAGPGTSQSIGTADGSLNDVFVVGCGGCVTGSSGTMTFAVTVHGSLAGDGQLTRGGPPGFADGNWSSFGEWVFNVSLNTTSPGNFGFGNVGLAKHGSQSLNHTGFNLIRGDDFGTFLLTVPVVFGGNNFLSMYGYASTRANAGGAIFGSGGSVAADAVFNADLSNTFSWGGITDLRDGRGNRITDFTALSSQTGFDYARAYTDPNGAIPEPGTWALIILGFGSVGATLRRRRRLAAA